MPSEIPFHPGRGYVLGTICEDPFKDTAGLLTGVPNAMMYLKIAESAADPEKYPYLRPGVIGFFVRSPDGKSMFAYAVHVNGKSMFLVHEEYVLGYIPAAVGESLKELTPAEKMREFEAGPKLNALATGSQIIH